MQHEPPAHLAGKSTAYDYLKSAPDSAWAWEFARRNALVRAALATRPPAERADDLQIVRAAPGAEASPIQWVSSVDDNAASATVVWKPELVPNVLHAVAVPTRLYGFGGAVLHLTEIALPKTLVVSDREQNLLGRRRRHAELATGDNWRTHHELAALFVDTKASKYHAARQLRLLECFRALRAIGALPGTCFPPHPRSARNAFVLEALDGYLAGKSHRDIAVGLYGHERVERDWSDPRENMRNMCAAPSPVVSAPWNAAILTSSLRRGQKIAITRFRHPAGAVEMTTERALRVGGLRIDV